MTLLLPLIAWPEWAHPATLVAGATGEGAALFCLLDRRGLSKPLWWWARELRALLWPLFAWSVWDQEATVVEGQLVSALLWTVFARSAYVQPATVVAGTTIDGAVVASVRTVGVGSSNHCVSVQDR